MFHNSFEFKIGLLLHHISLYIQGTKAQRVYKITFSNYIHAYLGNRVTFS